MFVPGTQCKSCQQMDILEQLVFAFSSSSKAFLSPPRLCWNACCPHGFVELLYFEPWRHACLYICFSTTWFCKGNTLWVKMWKSTGTQYCIKKNTLMSWHDFTIPVTEISDSGRGRGERVVADHQDPALPLTVCSSTSSYTCPLLFQALGRGRRDGNLRAKGLIRSSHTAWSTDQ